MMQLRKHFQAPVRGRRGQAMVLMSLTLLLVTLMVAMTIGLSMRVKEKMEAQQVADAAAYSTAVATSRTINTIAVLNRVHVATMAALAANQSLVSWVGLYRGALNDARLKASLALLLNCNPYNSACIPNCQRNIDFIQGISDAEDALEGEWDDLDKAAGEQTRTFQKGVQTYQAVTLQSLVDNFVQNQALATRIIEQATEGNPYGEWSVASGGDATTNREQAWAKDNATQTADRDDDAYFLVPRRETRELAVEAAHGTRANVWVTNRTFMGTQLIAKKLTDELDGTFLGLGQQGEGWYDNEASPGSVGNYGHSPRGAVGSDRATFGGQVDFCPYVLPLSARASVFSDDEPSSFEDEHEWNGKNDDEDDEGERHTMGDCSACPGIWTMFVDLNPLQVEKDERWNTLYGQPKVMTAIQRDYSRRDPPDPWMLDFDFEFRNGESFDNRGVQTRGGINLSHQYAVSTALSFYYRPGYWAEPPNFFNPFWRATLVSTGVDNRGHPNPQGDRAAVAGDKGEQLISLLRALPNGDTAADAVEALADNDFQGWQ